MKSVLFVLSVAFLFFVSNLCSLQVCISTAFSFLKESLESNAGVYVGELASTAVSLGLYEMFFKSLF